MRAGAIILVSLCAIVIVSSAQSVTIYVDVGNVSGPWLGTQEDPYQYIQEGIDAAFNEDVVLVMAGTYKGEMNTALDFGGKKITLRSDSGTEGCIINCENKARGVNFHSGESFESILEGFTIQNGIAISGGGIGCTNSSSPTIVNNIIKNCRAVDMGGGIYCESSSPLISGNTIEEGDAKDGGGICCEDDSSPTITENIITNNAAEEGGGICCISSSPVIQFNSITHNIGIDLGGGGIRCVSSSPEILCNLIAENVGNLLTYPGGADPGCGEGGGGIDCASNSSPLISNNIITGNSAICGGGISSDSSSPSLSYNTIYGNESRRMSFPGPPNPPYSLSGGAGISCSNNSSVTVINTILWENRAKYDTIILESIIEEGFVDSILVDESSEIDVSYSDIQGGWSGEGNIDVDPAFVDADNGDYHLMDYSLCIGAGFPIQPFFDFEGLERPSPSGSNPDIGAYETSWGTPQPIYVDDDNVDGPWNGTLTYPYQRIQDAIDAAWHGSAVVVRNGTYMGPGNVNLDYKGKAITVKSENSPENCIIDCEYAQGTRGFHFHSGETLNSILDGLTIRNGRIDDWPNDSADAYTGGGISCTENSSPKIMNSIVEGNIGKMGSGIYCESSSPMIVANIIRGNGDTEIEGSGGGIYCASSSPTIEGNVIEGNEAFLGGGIFATGSAAIIEDNHITKNIGTQGGGGIQCAASHLTINGNIITENEGLRSSSSPFFEDIPGVGGGAIDCYSDPAPEITNNLIIGNLAFYGAITCFCSSPVIVNNTIVGNGNDFEEPSAPPIGSLGGGGGGISCSYHPTYCLWPPQPIIVNTILWENRRRDGKVASIFFSECNIAVSYSDIQGGWPGAGNINLDPSFVDADNGDYHLMTYSLCIGAGTMTLEVPDEDIEGNQRPDPPGSNPDIGVYEISLGVPEAIYVDVDNTDGPWDGTVAHPYHRIQDAIDASEDGNTILVKDGEYKGSGNVDLDFKGKAINLKSENGTEKCIIECEENAQGFIFHNGETGDSILDGFTIQNGRAIGDNFPEDHQGGGIKCMNNSAPKIVNNVIMKCGAHQGGGIFCDSSSPTIEGNRIEENSCGDSGAGIHCSNNSSPLIVNNTIRQNLGDNSAGIYCGSSSPMIRGNLIANNTTFDLGGGGIHCDASSPTIRDNMIINNDGYPYLVIHNPGLIDRGVGGGGIECVSNSSPEIVNNIIVGNVSLYGGGISCSDSSPKVINNTIFGNSASVEYVFSPSPQIPTSLGGGGSAISCCNNSSVTVVNSIMWDNDGLDPILVDYSSEITISYSDVKGGINGISGDPSGSPVGPGSVNWDDGNIDELPMFVDADNGDYHLLDMSPCIGKGTITPDVPDKDAEGHPRPNPPGSIPDMGAYESPKSAPDSSTTLVVNAFSPVDLIITDPWLRTIDRDTSAIPGAVYIQADSNGDGDPDDMIVIPDAVLGNYSIQVVPEQDAIGTDTYTLDVSYGSESVRLAEDVPVQDIPAEPYVFFYPLRALKENWNLISLPLTPSDTDPGAVLSSIAGKYNSVWAFDPAAGWAVYAPGSPSDLVEMLPNKGYWVKMNEPGLLLIEGTDPEQTGIPLEGGKWNLVGYSSRNGKTPENAMGGIADAINSVWEYDPEKYWSIYTPGGASDLDVMKPGFGYWIKADESVVWDVNQIFLAAPPIAFRPRMDAGSLSKPEVPYLVWGRIEVEDMNSIHRNISTVVFGQDGKGESFRILGNVYMLYVPGDFDSTDTNLYVRTSDNLVKVGQSPPGEPGQIIRYDISVKLPPEDSLVHQNYPNPFNPDTWIPYQLKEETDVSIRIYSSTGKLVRTLNLGHKAAGFYLSKQEAAYWDGRNDAGESVASGIYFYTVKAGDLATIRKMVILR